MNTATGKRLGVFAAAVAIVIAGGIVATAAGRPAASHGSAVAIEAGSDRCSSWDEPQAGPVLFHVTNSAVSPLDVYLQDPSTGAVFAELEGLGAGATANVRAVLGNGHYRFVCLVEEEPAVDGATFTIRGASPRLAATPGLVPVTVQDLAAPVAAYGAWVIAQFPGVAEAIGGLEAAIDSGSISDARAAWLQAHVAYVRLGGAYGDFGPESATVDADFATLEQDLWPGPGIGSGASGVVAELAGAITSIQRGFDPTRFNPLDVGLRAHEILEDESLHQLNGDADALSGSALATIDAGIAATRAAIDPLRPLLMARGFSLADVDRALDALATTVDGYRTADGSWTPLADLDEAARHRLDARMGSAVEALAPIAAITDIRRGADS